MNEPLNVQAELAALLEFAARTAGAMRMNSAYDRTSETSPHARYDVMHMGDWMHNLGTLSAALVERDTKTVLLSCNWHISVFEGAIKHSETSGGEFAEAGTLRRWGDRVRLPDALEAVRSIERKALASQAAA